MSTEIYVPEVEKNRFTHSNSIYVDVLAKDASGIEKVNIRSEIQRYGLDQVTGDQTTYIVPVFTWEN